MRLETERLILRPIEETDAVHLLPIMNDPDVTENLLIPHPYPEEQVIPWIRSKREAMERRELFQMAIIPKDVGYAIGVCCLYRVSWKHKNAELVYWIGKDFWGKGIMTEAVKRMLKYGFEELGLERIWAGCFSRNKASAHILEKCGLKYEGCARKEYKKGEEFMDTLHFGIVKEDYFSD